MASRFKKKEFNFPVTSMIGSSFTNFNAVFEGRDTKGYRQRYLLSKSVSWILDWFRMIEDKRYGQVIEEKTIDEPPVFIIGFWRSGTTILHNLMCQNPDFGFVNTFQAVFPNHCLLNQGWLRRAASLLVPEKRPGDNVEFDFKYPQEEEIALGNMQPLSFYNFFYFPKDTEEFIQQSLFFKGIDSTELENWKAAYITLIKTALINTNGKQFISKNPPNTFRIPQLLEMFPDARFICIQRDLKETLYSFLRFTAAVRKGIKHQSYDKQEQDRVLVRLYRLMREKYETDRKLIPAGQLTEVDFSVFESNMLDEMERIYSEIGLPGFNTARPLMESYLQELGDYQRADHHFDQEFLRLINEELPDFL